MLIASWTARPPIPAVPIVRIWRRSPPTLPSQPRRHPRRGFWYPFPPRYSGFLAPGVLGRGSGLETASRFARDLMVQEVGFAKLQALGIKLVAADSPHSFLDDTPTSKLIRQILGAVSEFDKAMVVAKLKVARERKRVITGKKVEGDAHDVIVLYPQATPWLRLGNLSQISGNPKGCWDWWGYSGDDYLGRDGKQMRAVKRDDRPIASITEPLGS